MSESIMVLQEMSKVFKQHYSVAGSGQFFNPLASYGFGTNKDRVLIVT